METLRLLRAEDQALFIAAAQASQDLHQEWVQAPIDSTSFSLLLEKQGTHNKSLLIWAANERSLVGVVNVNEIVQGNFQSAYLGFYAFVPHAGTGAMSRGLLLAIDYCFSTLGLHRLEANIQPSNEASIALVRKCGFAKEGFSPKYLKINGTWKDHERWAIRHCMSQTATFQ